MLKTVLVFGAAFVACVVASLALVGVVVDDAREGRI